MTDLIIVQEMKKFLDCIQIRKNLLKAELIELERQYNVVDNLIDEMKKNK